MDENIKTEIQSATLERLLKHLDERKDLQNIDLMNLAGFCRNCLSRWFREEAEKKPITDPINIEIIFVIWFILIWSSLYDLFFINKSIPAMNKIINRIISNNSFEIDIEAPKNAKGIEPIK